MKKNCEFCGREFEPNKYSKNKQKYCSDSCRNMLNNRKKGKGHDIKKVTCPYCKKEFKPFMKNQKYCGSTCSILHQWPNTKREWKECVICGESFIPNRKSGKCCNPWCQTKKAAQKNYKGAKHKSNNIKGKYFYCKICGKKKQKRKDSLNTYCSKTCKNVELKNCKYCNKEFYFGFNKNFCKETCYINHYKKECLFCGEEYVHPTKKYCSKYCQISYYKKNMIGGYNQKLTKVKCVWCGKEKELKSGEKRRNFCSDECYDKYYKTTQTYKDNRKSERQKRRARKKGVKLENFKAEEIYKRDNWSCQICGKKIKKDKVVPHPKAPTIDHIIPLAKGGTHERRNVQAAHFDCNSKKGVKNADEQLRLF